MANKALRLAFGVTCAPIKGTRVLVKTLDHDFGGKVGRSLLVINDKAGTYTSTNTYDGQTGKGYDPEKMTHPLPPEGDGKWKAWRKSGYVDGNVADHPVIEAIEAPKAPKAPKAQTAKGAAATA